MTGVKACLFLIILCIFIEIHQCYRSSSSRGGGAYRSRPRATYRTTRRPPTQYTTRQSYTSRSGTTRRSQGSTTPRTYRSSTPSSGSYNNIPPRPGSAYTTGNSPQNVKIVNKYNYHYPGYYSVPVQSSYPGYFYSPTSYHYGSHDTGSTALGFFLGYSLAKITTPTYSHYSFYDGYRPRYDHYEVHHYYHNKDSVPQSQEIRSNSIVGCVGDSVTICPANTTSLCTSNGALMCVVSATSTVPCTDNRQVNCVTSTIACVNNTAPECKGKSSTTINIPCVSNAQVQGDLKVENNTIVPVNVTTPVPSSTQNPITTTSTQYPITTTSTQYPITTTPQPQTRRKRDAAQNFCVTVIAVPSPKQETEGEKVLKDAKSVIENFFGAAFNI